MNRSSIFTFELKLQGSLTRLYLESAYKAQKTPINMQIYYELHYHPSIKSYKSPWNLVNTIMMMFVIILFTNILFSVPHYSFIQSFLHSSSLSVLSGLRWIRHRNWTPVHRRTWHTLDIHTLLHITETQTDTERTCETQLPDLRTEPGITRAVRQQWCFSKLWRVFMESKT